MMKFNNTEENEHRDYREAISRICPSCRGFGFVLEKEEKVVCSVCDGDGCIQDRFNTRTQNKL